MPTTIPLVSSAASDELLRGRFRVIENNADLLVITLFSAIGLGLTIGFAFLFPLAAKAAEIGWMVS